MKTRLATLTDTPDLVRLKDQIQYQHALQYPDVFEYPIDKEATALSFKENFESEFNYIIVAQNGKDICGYLSYELQKDSGGKTMDPRNRIHINHIVVDSSQRRTGVASTLFDWIDDSARKNGSCQISLETVELNKDAHQFFESRGFSIFKRTYSKVVNSSQD